MVGQTPTPYYTAIQNALADHVDLTVIFMGGATNSASSLWAQFADSWGARPRFRALHHPAFDVARSDQDWRAQFSVGVAVRLAQIRPEVLILHSWGPTMAEPLLWAVATRCPVVLWAKSAQGSGVLRSRITDRYRSAFVRHAGAIVSIGSLATQYVSDLGSPSEKVLQTPLASHYGKRLAAGIWKLGRPGRRFVMVGRLVPRKRPLDAIRAFIDLATIDSEATLHVVGDGPLLAEAMRLAEGHKRIRFSGRLEGSQLINSYLDADVLVVPATREVWGLVVNEGLAAGLFVIASDQVASAVDLVRPDFGCLTPAGDIPALTDAMVQAIDNDNSAHARQERRASVADVTPEQFAAVIARAIAAAVAGSPAT